MRLHLNIFTLLCIVLAPPSAYAGGKKKVAAEPKEEVVLCELLLEQYRADSTPRVELQELYRKAIVKAKPGEEQNLRTERAKLVMLYDLEIAKLEGRMKDLKMAFKAEFHWSEKVNFFSGARLWIVHEISAMELDLREMKSERSEVFRLIPRANIVVRAVRAIRDQWSQGRDNLARATSDAFKNKQAAPEAATDAKFLHPMNPASPYYHLPMGSSPDDEGKDGTGGQP